MIYRYSWGAAWILFGLATMQILYIPHSNWAIGLAFIVAGVSYMMGE